MDFGTHMCMHPTSSWRKTDALVRGRVSVQDQKFCKYARNENCGPDAIYFEPKWWLKALLMFVDPTGTKYPGYQSAPPQIPRLTPSNRK
jgi:hypothetical protein